MSDISIARNGSEAERARKKFQDPDWTARGEPRASVPLVRLETLWVNTGTLCNIECVNCYMESSPKNDQLVYISAKEFAAYLDEIRVMNLATKEIGFTGGEPFMNPDMLEMTTDALSRGHEVLVLTNAMQPMQRPSVKASLLRILQEHGDQLTLRVSLDHYTQRLHEIERGPGTWQVAIDGLNWLASQGFRIAIAGRTCWNESETESRAGYAALIRDNGWPVDAGDPSKLVLLPEMDVTVDVPEITTRCWSILGLHPREIMCASSRMVVKRKGAEKPTVLPCTLLPYDTTFEMGATLQDAANANGGMFASGAVKLCHPHCAKFCVLGGGNCAG